MPVYEITAPNGSVYQVEGEGTEQEALAHFQATYKEDALPASQLGLADKLKMLASDTIAKPAARGVARGVASLPNYLADVAVRGANSAGLSNVPQEGLPSARFNKFLDQVGLPASSGLANQLVEATGETLGGMYGTPGIGTAANAMPSRATLSAHPTAQEYARWVGLQSNYKLPPTSVPKTHGGNILESVSFPSKLKQEMVTDNQFVRNASMREAAGDFVSQQSGRVVPGLRKGEVLTSKGLTDNISGIWNEAYKPLIDNPVRVPFNATFYKNIRDIIKDTAGNPSSPEFRKDIATRLQRLNQSYNSDDALAVIKSLRSDANDIANSANKDTAMQRALSDAADALESRLETLLPKAQYKDYTSGRRQMAQLSTIRDAVLDPTGNVDAGELANRIAKGLPTTGRPYTAGLFSANFPELSGLSRNAETELFDRVSPGMGVSMIGGAFQALGKPIRSYLRSSGDNLLGIDYQTLLRSPGLLDTEKRMLLTTPATTYNLFQPE